MDNDGIHKFGYGHRDLFADLMRLVAPDLAAELDFARAVELPAAYVQPAQGRFTQRFGDIAWRVPRWRDGEGGAGPEVVVLIEFQSTVDRDMGGRVRGYAGMARERLAERHGEPPALLPVVLYNGSDRWTAPGAMSELPEWSMRSQLTLAPFQGWDYVLLSLERLLSSGDLVRLPPGNRAAATLRLQAERTLSGLMERFRREWTRFAGEADAPTRRVLHVWAGALLADMGGAESALPALADLEGLKEGTDMTTVSQARLGKWFAGVRAELVAEGVEQERIRGLARLQQGIEEERTRGMARLQQERARGFTRLRRQVAIKFGEQTAERLSTLLGAGIAAERMERLSDRVSDWIVECEHSEDLLARVSALVGNGDAES